MGGAANTTIEYGTVIGCRVRQDKNFLNNPSLVVRVNEKYTSFSMAAPILMSVLMFKVGVSVVQGATIMTFHKIFIISFHCQKNIKILM